MPLFSRRIQASHLEDVPSEESSETALNGFNEDTSVAMNSSKRKLRRTHSEGTHQYHQAFRCLSRSLFKTWVPPKHINGSKKEKCCSLSVCPSEASPSTAPTAGPSVLSEDDVHKMEQEAAGWRDHVCIFDEATDREELLDIIRSKIVQGQRKEQEMQLLSKTLHSVQNGLAEAEGEKERLVERTRKLEAERDTIQQVLVHREAEIAALSKTCTTQADKIEKATKLQEDYQDLSIELVEVRSELAQREVHNQQRQIVEWDTFKELKEARDGLLDNLQDLQSKLDDVTARLKKSMADVERLTSEKSQWENERKRLKERVDNKLDWECLGYDEYIIELHGLHTENMERIKAVHEEEMNEMKKRLDEYTRVIDSLKDEVSRNYDELMTATTELDLLRRERAGELQPEDQDEIEALLAQKDELSDVIHEKDTEIAELSAEILKMEIQKEFDQYASSEVLSVNSQMRREVDGDEWQGEELDGARASILELERALQQATEEFNPPKQKKDYSNVTSASDLQSRIESLAKASEDQRTMYESTLAATEETIASLQSKLDDLRNEMQARELKHESRVSQILSEQEMHLSKFRSEMQNLVQTVETDNSALQVRLAQKETAIASLTDQLRHVRADKESQERTHKDILMHMQSSQAQLLSSLQNKLERLTDDSYCEKTRHSESMAAKQKTIEILQNELDKLGNEMDTQEKEHHEDISVLLSEHIDRLSTLELQVVERINVATEKEKIRYQETLATKEEDIVALNQDVAFLQELARKQAEEHNRIVLQLGSEADALSDNLQLKTEEVCRLQLAIKTQAENHAQEIHRYQEQLWAAKLDINRKETEIRDLRANALEGQKKAIGLLEGEVVRLSDQIMTTQESAAEERSSMQAEIDALSVKCSQLENDAETKSTERKTEVNNLNHTISDLRRDMNFSELTLMGYERKLGEMSSERNELLARIQSLEQTTEDLKTESCRLEAEEEVSNAVEQTATAVDVDHDFASKREEELEEEVAKSKQRLIEKDDQLAKLESLLHERTSTLDQVVNETKEIKESLSEKESQLANLMTELHSLQLKIVDKDMELEKLCAELKHKEAKYLDDILGHQNSREIAELELAEATEYIKTMRRNKVDNWDLVKENEDLKDKIRRQEAYLKKKLEKEKALRARMKPKFLERTSKVSPSPRRSSVESNATHTTAETATLLDWD